MKDAQSCTTLCDTMDCIVHGILQARILERVAFPFSRGSSQPRDPTAFPALAGRFFTTSTTLGIGCIYKISLGKRILFRTKLAWASLVVQLGKNPPARNKTWVPTLTTTLQYSFGSFSHSNQRRKINKRNPD